jgi:glycosyltransferase involved in cell wall biosynthesis
MTDPLSICVNTQTPLVQLLPPASGAGAGSTKPVDLGQLQEGSDYQVSPGGVTRMVLPLLRRLRAERIVGDVHWVALNPSGPRSLQLDGINLHQVSLEKDRLAGYGNVKEAIWGAVHGLDEGGPADGLLWTEDYSEYAYYNRASAETIQKLDKEYDFDAFYVHDFQQLAVGHMLQSLKPKIFRWHIPFDETMIPEEWRSWLATYFNSYDLVVVSARRYLASLKAFGHTGKVRRMYPYVDPNDFSVPAPAEVLAACRSRWIPDDADVILVVGRMDPMKGQDRAIRAFARVAKRFPTAHLVLVGNGSFSASSGGLGLSKGGRWRAELQALVDRLELGGRVLFTGHVTQHELDCLYERARFTALPSVQEGFGLVVVESWLHRRPTIVTDRAGIAELVDEGRNGLLVDPEDTDTFADRMSRLLIDDGTLARKLGQAGRRSAQKCSIDTASRAESRLLAEITGG